MTPSSQLLLHWPATRYKGSQILGGGGDPPQGAFDGIVFFLGEAAGPGFSFRWP